MDKYKSCSKCKQSKSQNQFYFDKRASDGFQSQCKQCIANYRRANRDKVLEQKRRYRSKPETKEKESAYAKEYKRRNPEVIKRCRSSENKSLKSERFKRWALANKERIKANRQRAVRNNPDLYRSYSAQRRGRLRAVKSFVITSKELIAIYKQDCFYCKDKGGTIDHVIPISRGGSHGIGNLVPACSRCNSSKKDKTIMEWRKAGTLPSER